MLFKSNFFRITSALCLILTLSILTFADTIRLKDGSIIKGKIVSFGGGKFVVMVGQRQMDFSAIDVESISFDGDTMPVMNIKTSGNVSTETKNNSTVITVKQNPETTEPQTPAPQVKTEPAPVVNTPIKPIEIGVKVLADNTTNGWTNSGWVVKKGQRIKITGTGSVSLGNGRYSKPEGIASLSDKDKLMPKESTGALIAVIGDNNNDFIFIGESREFTATQDGSLFLGVNEGNLEDNSGAFNVKVEISPETGY